MNVNDIVNILRNFYQGNKDEYLFGKLYEDIKLTNRLNFSVNDIIDIMYNRINHEAFKILWLTVNEGLKLNRYFFMYNIIYDILKNRIEFELYYDNEKDIISKEKIVSPVFIMGMPRTGSTFFQALMTLDYNNRTIIGWETVRPFPVVTTDEEIEERIKLCKLGFKIFNDNIKNMKIMHYVNESNSNECTEWLAYDFTSLKFSTLFNIPEYSKWLLGLNDLIPVLKLFQRQLQFFQNKNRRERWVLKSPAHLQHFQYLLKIFPDLKVINLHRDPLVSLPSAASLVCSINEFFNLNVDKKKIAKGQLIYFSSIYNNYMNEVLPIMTTDRFIDIDYNDFISNPSSIIKTVYNQFGYDFHSDFENKIKLYLEEKSLDRLNEKYGKHIYNNEMFGLDETEIKERFASWYKLYVK